MLSEAYVDLTFFGRVTWALALSALRSGGVSQVPEIIDGKGGTRTTLDPGIIESGRSAK
jgi:hypothetical protein